MATAISISEVNVSDQNESDVESIWNEMKNALKSTPTMVFSVIGDSDNFVPKLWPKSAFQKALVEAGKTGGDTWILYRGGRKEVSRVVRNAYVGGIRKSGLSVKLISVGGALTRNKHNSFETRNRMTDEFLSDFEKFVSEQEYSYKMPVPVAVIVCEGDIETITHIVKTLKNKLPVIFIKGSEKAVDFVLDNLENSSMLCEKARIALGVELSDCQCERLKKRLKIIKQNMHLVGIFDLQHDDQLMLSNIIGKAVSNSWAQRNI